MKSCRFRKLTSTLAVTQTTIPTIKIERPSAQPVLFPDGTSALWNKRLLLSFDASGQPLAQPLADNACIIDPGDLNSLTTFIREYVPAALLSSLAEGRAVI